MKKEEGEGKRNQEKRVKLGSRGVGGRIGAKSQRRPEE